MSSKGNRTKGNTKVSISRRLGLVKHPNFKPQSINRTNREFFFSRQFEKPSSSSNAFNLFLKYGGEQPTFSDLSNYSGLTDESSHPIFVAIKKCYKKDIVTKSKGLKDILELFTSHEGDDHSFLLKHWIKVFLSLSNEDDFQVREVTLSTFEQINKLVNKQLTPFLKQIVPHWLCLTGDPHGNVAKLASQSFSSTFGKNKLNDAFLFAKEPIVDNVNRILFKTSYVEKKNEIRLIPGAFYSVIVLSKIAKDDQYLNDELAKLLDNEQFWKYSKFGDNNVQSSWFNLINSLLSLKFDLVSCHVKKIGQATFSRLGEKNVALQESIWSVMFTLMRLDEKSCCNELNYDKVFKSFKDLLKRSSSFNPDLLIVNLHLLLKYFLTKNEDKEQFLISTFDLFQAEIVSKKDQTLAINLYFESLLFIIQNSELISSNAEQTRALLDQLINQRLSSTIDQLSSDSKCLQGLFKKLVSFSSNLKSLNCDQQVQLINELILKTVSGKLNGGDVLDFQSIKGLLNIIFNLKAYQLKKKLNLFSSSSVSSFEFVKYNFEFYDRTDDQQTKQELLKEILRIVLESKMQLTSDFIEFLNYLVQFASYLNVLDDQIAKSFIVYFKQIARQLNSSEETEPSSNKRNLMIRLYYAIHQINLKSSRPIDVELLGDPANVFSFIFTLQLFRDEERIDSITESILSVYDVLFKRFENSLTATGSRRLLDQLDEEDHDELAAEVGRNKSGDKLVRRLAALLHNEFQLDLLNTIYSLLSLKLSNSTYESLFDGLMRLNQHDEVHIMNHLVLDYLQKNNKVLSVKTIETLIFGFIEFSNQRSLETTNVWVDVLFQSLRASTDRQESSNVVRSLSAKFKRLLLDTQNPLTFDQLNSIVSCIYNFVINLASLSEYSDATTLSDLVKGILVDENEFKQLRSELNAKVFEFLWIKTDFTEHDFPSAQSKELKIPHLANASYASLKVSKLLRFTNDVQHLKGALEDLTSESTDEQISNLLQNNSNLEYLLDYSSLSYSYLKILLKIFSYGASPANDLIEHYTAFYEQIYKKLDDSFVKTYANRIYQSSHEDLWSVTSLHHLLDAVGAENVFDFNSLAGSLKVNNFSLIMKFIAKQNLELFLQELVQYNLVSKVNYPDNFDDIKEYLNIIAFCLTDYTITIDSERHLQPIVNCLMAYQEKIQAKEIEDQLYLRDQLDAQLIASIVAAMNFLDQFVRRNVDDLSSKFTNFLFYSLLKWSEVLSLDENVLLANHHLCSYLNHLFSLINNVAFLMQLNISNLRGARSNWLENYAFKINERLFRVFVKLSRLEINFVQYDMVNTLGKCLIEIDNENLIKMQLKDLVGSTADAASAGGEADEHDLISSKLSNNFDRLFNVLADLLMRRNSLFSLPSHHLIGNYLKLLATQLNGDQKFLADLDDKLYLKPPNFLLQLVNRINEDLSADSGFNEYANSLKLVYFLIWKQLLDFWDRLNEQIKCTMANYLKDKGPIDDLFEHFNNILPIDRHLLAVYYKHGLSKSKITAHFKKAVQLESASLWSVNTLYHLSCQIYLQIFKRMPTTMRLWINTAANQSEIKQFTSTFVSDIVIQDELRTIQEKASNSLENLNLKLKIRPSSNEVLASYSFEDIKVELALTLPTNYPIGLIKINAGDRVGVSVEKWRSWELQLTTFLAQVRF